MSDEVKQEIVNALIPTAVIKAVTQDSVHALHHLNHDRDFICIYDFPFSVGREARTQLINGQLKVLERRRSANGALSNDLYLFDQGPKLQISREHFLIEKRNNSFYLVDRGSACGMVLNEKHFGGKDKGGENKIKDGDIIGIGKEGTPYFFKFIVM